MAVSRGKEFEGIVKRDIEALKVVEIQRLYDVMNGYKNIRMPSDFCAYLKPHKYYLECKAINTNTLNKQEIRQYDDLLEKSKYDGLYAGIFIWYVQSKVIYWVNIKFAESLFLTGKKSINIKDLMVYQGEKNISTIMQIDARFPRILPTCDFRSFFGIEKELFS